MRYLWTLSYGLLAGALVSWLLGLPPDLHVFGIACYQSMMVSSFIVLFVGVVTLLKSIGGRPPSSPA